MSISTSGDGPSLDLDKLAASLSGTVFYGWYVGFQEFYGSILSGLTSSYQAVGEWISGSLIPALFEIGLGPAGVAIESNAEFIEGLGIVGLPVAAVELIIVAWLLLQIIEIAVDRLDGVISA
jgi:hypothetical protein